MKKLLSLLLLLSLSSCGSAQEKKLAIDSSLASCFIVNSKIEGDFNRDNKKDVIYLAKPSSHIKDHCQLFTNKDFNLVIDISGYAEPILTDAGIDYLGASAQLKKVNHDGFSISYETGQSVKCDNEAFFSVKKDKSFLKKLKTLCYVPNSNLGWQERSYDKNINTIGEDTFVSNQLSDMQEVFFGQKTYILSRKSYIYSEPSLNKKTKAYFIKGDVVEALEHTSRWIKVAYAKNKKTGWLSKDSLKDNAIKARDNNVTLPFTQKQVNPNDTSEQLKSEFPLSEKNYISSINQLFGGASDYGFYVLPNKSQTKVFIGFGLFENESEEYVSADNPNGMFTEQENYLITVNNGHLDYVKLGERFHIGKQYKDIYTIKEGTKEYFTIMSSGKIQSLSE